MVDQDLLSIGIGRLDEPARVRATFHQCVSSKLRRLEIDDDLPHFNHHTPQRTNVADCPQLLDLGTKGAPAGESLSDIPRAYGVAHTMIMRLSPALRSPEARPGVLRHSPLSADPGGRLPSSLAVGSRATTRGAQHPQPKPAHAPANRKRLPAFNNDNYPLKASTVGFRCAPSPPLAPLAPKGPHTLPRNTSQRE